MASFTVGKKSLLKPLSPSKVTIVNSSISKGLDIPTSSSLNPPQGKEANPLVSTHDPPLEAPFLALVNQMLHHEQPINFDPLNAMDEEFLEEPKENDYEDFRILISKKRRWRILFSTWITSKSLSYLMTPKKDAKEKRERSGSRNLKIDQVVFYVPIFINIIEGLHIIAETMTNEKNTRLIIQKMGFDHFNFILPQNHARGIEVLWNNANSQASVLAKENRGIPMLVYDPNKSKNILISGIYAPAQASEKEQFWDHLVSIPFKGTNMFLCVKN
ncbi:hypothetical protein Cgig2_006325 [Carnegiea gigantea]|uniref:Uncharacterized protein n=1 Tax=Carnegiea gigantea TaxID=171969 RepID=A0A9Q1JSL9_9CARY|nr:hypothetical protein Cgig2_006325 [Carnegiea gigantea]